MPPSDEDTKLGKDFLRQGLAGKHIIGDAVHSRRLPWNRPWDPNEALEFGHNFTTNNGDRTNFNDPVSPMR